MEKFTDFYEAYHFVNNHYIFMTHEGYREICRSMTDHCLTLEDNIYFVTSMYTRFDKCLCIDVVKVNPETNRIDDNEEFNTKTQVWFECGSYNDDYATHDTDLDCGGDSYEEAIIELANLVHKKYGDNTLENIKKFFENESAN